MAKRRFGVSEDKINRFTRAGRGTGEGMDYTPWLTVHDLSSVGRAARMLGRHNKRVHHLFSDIERGAFLEYDWRADVCDIREQFPLDRETTRLIAAEMCLPHPRDPRSRVDVVMTTDLLITFFDGSVRPLACKPTQDLGDRRVKEKLEIERRYWNLLGRDWKLWTERSTNKVRTENLAYLHEYIDADEWTWVKADHWSSRTARFLALLERTDRSEPFARFAAAFDRGPGLSPGDCVATMRYLACRKRIGFELNVKFNQMEPVGRSITCSNPTRLELAA